MPVITVKIPEGKSDSLLKQLLTQFAQLQRQLLSLKSSGASEGVAPVLRMLGKQQDALLKAFARMGSSQKSPMGEAMHGASMSRLSKRLDRMESALVAASKKSRNRTFGSNY